MPFGDRVGARRRRRRRAPAPAGSSRPAPRSRRRSRCRSTAPMIPLTWVPWPLPSCGVASFCDEVVPGQTWPGQVGVVGLHARVDDRHHRARAGRDRVRGVGLDQVEVPLLAPPRVGRARGGGEAGGSSKQGDAERSAPAKELPGIALYAITYVRMEVATHVGSRVRALREGMDLSLRDLAERSGVSAPMLSPGRARRDEPDADGRRPHRRRPRPAPLPAPAPRRGRHRHGRARRRAPHAAAPTATATRSLTPPLPGQRAEVSRHTLAPGARTGGPGDPPMHEPGARETAVVQRGTLDLRLSTAPATSSPPATAVTFDADLPHHFENHGRGGGGPARGRVGGAAPLMTPKTLFDKIWAAHEVAPGLLYIDLHLVHEVTSPQAFDGLRLAGRKVRRPDRTLATADHNVPDRRHAGRRPHPRRALARAGRDARAQLRGVRRPASTRWAPTARASST